MVRRTLRICAWIAGSAVTACAVLYLLGLAINWRDEEPSAAARQLTDLYRDRPSVADRDNGFVYVMGFEVAPDQDPHAMGLRRIAWMNRALSDPAWDIAEDPLPDSRKEVANAALREFSEACRTRSARCVAALRKGDELLEQWLATEPWLATRYESLLAHTGWREWVPVRVEAPLPAYKSIMDGQRLWLLQARSLAMRNDPTGVRLMLEKDIRFWRMALASSDVLISRMIATVALNRHFDMGALILRELPADSMLSAIPEDWSRELSDRELSIQRSTVGEWIFAMGLLNEQGARTFLESYGEGEGSVADRLFAAAALPFFQRTATLNLYADHSLQAVRILDVPVKEYATAPRELAVLDARLSEVHWSAYNPVGCRIFSFHRGGLDTYAREPATSKVFAVLRSRPSRCEQPRYPLRRSPMRSKSRLCATLTTALHSNGTIKTRFKGLETSERGRHLFFY
jgi:hypothetical protein